MSRFWHYYKSSIHRAWQSQRGHGKGPELNNKGLAGGKKVEHELFWKGIAISQMCAIIHFFADNYKQSFLFTLQ